MSPEPPQDDIVRRATDAIDVERRPAGSGSFAARVILHGEHDLATLADVQKTLSGIHGNVLVDLSACEFIDSSTIGALIAASKTLERDGFFLEILAPPENTLITRTLEVVGMRDLVVVHTVSPT